MAETIARANHRVLLGHFALDMSDGELSFRANLLVVDGLPTHDQVGHLLAGSCWAVDRYHRAGIRLVYCDDLSPAEVIAEVEMAD